jgi:hypothetical protein
MKYIRTVGSHIALGSVGVVVMSVLSGCEAPQEKPQNKFMVIEQQPNGKYLVVEEMPTDGESRAIIRELDPATGVMKERFMNESEMKALAEQEYAAVQNGTSEVTKPSDGSSGGEGMGLAGTILAVAAGSLLGNMIGNALMNNSNFANRANSVNKSAYHRSSAGGATGTKSASGTDTKKSFFGDSKKSTSSTSTSTFGS